MAVIQNEIDELKIMLDTMSDAEIFELMDALMTNPNRKNKNDKTTNRS